MDPTRRGATDPHPYEPGPDDPERPASPPTPLFPAEAVDRVSVFSRLFERRTVFLRGPIEDDKADVVAAQLLSLDAESPDPVTLYIDSPGGDTFGMFAIHDTMQLMRAPVHTRCTGMAASAGAFLLATGTGTRSATPNARIMIHQPVGGARGQATDIDIQAKEILRMKAKLNEIIVKHTGQTLERVEKDSDRDYFMGSPEARQYGILDEVITFKKGAISRPGAAEDRRTDSDKKGEK